MDLYLHKVIHPQAPENYRVILKDDDCQEIEIGSIGIQHAARVHVLAVAIDTVVPMRGLEARGIGRDRDDCMRQFRAAWEKLSSAQIPLGWPSFSMRSGSRLASRPFKG